MGGKGGKPNSYLGGGWSCWEMISDDRIFLEVLRLEELHDFLQGRFFLVFILVIRRKPIPHSTLELYSVLGSFDFLDHHNSEELLHRSCITSQEFTASISQTGIITGATAEKTMNSSTGVIPEIRASKKSSFSAKPSPGLPFHCCRWPTISGSRYTPMAVNLICRKWISISVIPGSYHMQTSKTISETPKKAQRRRAYHGPAETEVL